jgi:PHD/YefM family antitoxin component YafN of YafNO toxin-antitoxin module
MITKVPKTVRTSDLRKDLAKYMREAAIEPIVISTDRGGDSRVLLGSDLYNTLVEAYEDLADRATLEERIAKDDGSRTGIASLRTKYGV